MMMAMRHSVLVCVAILSALVLRPSARPAPDAEVTPGGAFRLHGTVEPIRSRLFTVPRLTGSGNGPLVIVHLAKAGTVVHAGDLLIEFDRAVQIKTAHDREAEYRDLVEQINKKKADQMMARAADQTAMVEAKNAVRSAELDLLDKDLVAQIVAERNALALEEAKQKIAELQHTFDLKRLVEAADLKILEISRDRSFNAWKHAEGNAEHMRIVAPIPGLVVLKVSWKSGTMAEVVEGDEVNSGQPLMEVVDPSAMRVRARVNQADVTHVRVGQTAQITLNSYPSRTFPGRLEQLSPIGTPSNMSDRVRTFVALFSIDGTDPHLLPDLAAAIDVGEAPAGVKARK
jgi:HlyD family secretion protein